MGDIDLPPCLIFIDKEGRWFHKGAEMVHREFIQLFYENMELDDVGRYIITIGNDRCYVEVEDTPFVIRQVRFEEGEQEGLSRCMLYLSDDTWEMLRPDSLFIGPENVLYTRVKEGAFPARFLRPAYYQLAQNIEEEDGTYVLPLNDGKYVIGTPEP
jgi:hypothetical protein